METQEQILTEFTRLRLLGLLEERLIGQFGEIPCFYLIPFDGHIYKKCENYPFFKAIKEQKLQIVNEEGNKQFIDWNSDEGKTFVWVNKEND